MKNTRNNVAYIDGANLHNRVGTFDWEFDYGKFRVWLREKYDSLLLKRTGARIAYINDQRVILAVKNEKAPDEDEPHKGLSRGNYVYYRQTQKKVNMPVDNHKTNTPNCLGLIMDGNRRFAKAHGLPVFDGHARGYEKLTDLLAWCKEADIKHVAVYAFSTENWRRTEEEVGYLMQLFRAVLFKEAEKFKKENGRVKFIGQKERFDKDLQEGMKQMEEETAGGEYTLYVCISYGGRAEILDAAQKLAKEKTPEEFAALTEEEFGKFLWTSEMPEPDIIIRTGGEKRLSNFLTWQSVYSELFFSDTLWPDFSKEEFTGILEEYAKRERRRGK